MCVDVGIDLKPAYNPKISVAMACYNAEKYIKAAIKSIMRQTYTNWEIIFVEDFSDDHTLAYIKKYIRVFKLENKFKLIHHSYNQGYGSTLYDAIKHSTGELVAVIDSDDSLAGKYAFSKMVKAHENNPNAALVYSTYYYCRNKLKTCFVKDIAPLPEGMTYLDALLNPGKRENGKGKYDRVSHLKVFKKDMYNKTIGLQKGLKKAVDRDLVLKLEEVGDLVFINEPLYIHRKHDGNITNKWGHLTRQERNEIMDDKKQMLVNAQRRRGLLD